MVGVYLSEIRRFRRPKWSQGQNFGLGLGLDLENLASVSALASNLWPGCPGLVKNLKCMQKYNQMPSANNQKIVVCLADSSCLLAELDAVLEALVF